MNVTEPTAAERVMLKITSKLSDNEKKEKKVMVTYLDHINKQIKK